jgi:hypothetical protein
MPEKHISALCYEEGEFTGALKEYIRLFANELVELFTCFDIDQAAWTLNTI